MTRPASLLLIAVLLGLKSVRGETAPRPKEQPSDGPANTVDLSGCTDAIREVRAPIKELHNAVALLQAELTALRKTQEEIKTALTAQQQKKGPGASSETARAARQLEAMAAANSQLREDVMSGLGRLTERLGDADLAGPNASCAAEERLVRRASAEACSAMAAAVVANLTGARPPRPDQERRQANATDLGMRRLLRALGLRTATNASAERALAELRGCAQAKRIAKLFQVRKEFRTITTQELDVDATGERVGDFPLEECALLCLLKGDYCRGFQVSAARQCMHLTKPSWSEKVGRKETVWAPRDGVRKTACKKSQFPYSLGRSRYRIVDKQMTWPKALKACEMLGAKLVQISSERERRFVHQLVSRHGLVMYYHVGLYQLAVASKARDHWYWYPSMDRFDLHKRWDSGQPNFTGGTANRGVMKRANALFQDVDASSWGSVCECFVV